VPTAALLEGDRVLVLEDGVLEERSLTLGLRNWRYAELQSGLSEGKDVVISLDRVGVEPGERAIIEDEDTGAGS
jgi:HlyD family secretion protein